MQVSVTVFDVRENRREWKETIKPEMVEHLVFLDESGVNTNLTRLYGRAPSLLFRQPVHRPLAHRVRLCDSFRIMGRFIAWYQ